MIRLGLLLACSQQLTADTSIPSDTDTDTDVDTDTDTDVDADTDADTDADVDTDTGPDECALEPVTPAVGSTVNLGACYTEELQCGGVYEHTLTGGEDVLDFNVYDDWFCQGMYAGLFLQEYDGPERVYYFDSPASASVTVDTGCDGLAVRSARVANGAECLTQDHAPVWCETPNGLADRPYVLGPNELGTFDTEVAIIIDTLNGVGGAYTITVDCP